MPPFNLADEWMEYERCVVPEDADDAQRWETRRAFYAGAITVYAAMLMLDGAVSRAEFNDMMAGMQREFERYGAMVKAGMA